MKRILLFLSLLLIAGTCGAQMIPGGSAFGNHAGGGPTPAFVQAAPAMTTDSTTLAFSGNITSGDAIIVAPFYGSTGITLQVTDSQGNTFTSLKQATLAGDADTIGVFCAIAGSTAADNTRLIVESEAEGNQLDKIHELNRMIAERNGMHYAARRPKR